MTLILPFSEGITDSYTGDAVTGSEGQVVDVARPCAECTKGRITPTVKPMDAIRPRFAEYYIKRLD